MRKPFENDIDIEDISLLYGRKRTISSLFEKAEMLENAAIIGPRRFGKTCILKSLRNEIIQKLDFVFPVYFNAKSEGISKDSVTFFRKLAATIACEMCESGILKKGKIRFKDIELKIKISTDKIAIEEQIKTLSSERQSILFLTFANELIRIGKTLLIMFDDIDYVFISALRQASDFSRVREATSKLKFWVSGPSTFSSLCSKIGSPELNKGLENVHLKPISKAEANKMWADECSKIHDENKRSQILSRFDYAFDKSGGVPFYLKCIGKWMSSSENDGKEPTYMIIRDHLKELVDSKLFLDSERNTLNFLANNTLKEDSEMSDGINLLEAKGLVDNTSHIYSIPIGFLKDYLIAVNKEKSPGDKRLEDIVDEIKKIRSNVNKVWLRKELWKTERPNGTRSMVPFQSSDEDPITFDIIKKVCRDEASYMAFSGALYQMYYEGSFKGNNLPQGFKPRPGIDRVSGVTYDSNTSDFPQYVMVNRHMFGHRDFTPDGTIAITDTDLVNAINEGHHPKCNEDYTKMQYNLLRLCLDELNDMQDYVESL